MSFQHKRVLIWEKYVKMSFLIDYQVVVRKIMSLSPSDECYGMGLLPFGTWFK